MIARLIFNNGVSGFIEGTCTQFPTPSDESVWEYVFDTSENGVITGIDCEGIFIKPVVPPLVKTDDTTLTLQFKGDNIPVLVWHEIELVDKTPVKELPLIMNDLRTWTGKKRFEEKIKNV